MAPKIAQQITEVFQTPQHPPGELLDLFLPTETPEFELIQQDGSTCLWGTKQVRRPQGCPAVEVVRYHLFEAGALQACWMSKLDTALANFACAVAEAQGKTSPV